MKKSKYSKRKFIYRDGNFVNKNHDKVFLVFWLETTMNTKGSKTSSTGPYYSEKEAYNIMHSHLANGICSWVVSYNG